MLSIEPHVGQAVICRARQEMTYKFLQTDCTHFMQLDDDIQLPPDAIVKLVEADKPIVGGAYRLKQNVSEAALRAFRTFNTKDVPDELVKVKYLSTGCFLQKREAVEAMWDKYTNLKYRASSTTDTNEGERRALYMAMIHDGEYLSDDWAYCQRATDAGYDIWLHTGVKCGHWGIYNYEFETG